MAWAFVQKNITTQSATGTTTSAALSGQVAGNTNVVLVGQFPGGASVTLNSVTDNNSNTYTLIEGPVSIAAGEVIYAYFCAKINAGSATIKATWSATVTFTEIQVFEYSGLNTPTVDAHTNVTSSSAVTNLTAGPITLTAGDLVISYARFNAGETTVTQPSGFTSRFVATTDFSWSADESSPGGSVSAKWTVSPTATTCGVILFGLKVFLPSVTLQAAFGITSATLKGLIAGGSSVPIQAKLGITSATLKGLLAGGAGVQIQAKLGITTATLKGLIAGGATVPLKALFGIAGQIGKLAISLVNLQASMGITNAGLAVPGSVLTGGTPPVAVPVAYSMWGGGHSSGNL